MRGGNFDSIFKPQYKVYKVKDGKNVIRVLPPTWDKARHYGYDIHVNYNIGPDNQSYLSLSKMKGEADPIAEARHEAERDSNTELVKALQPTHRVMIWLIDRLAEDEGPQLWAMPFTVDKAFANLSFDEDTKEVVYIDDPEQGCDVRFYREGTGKNNTKYDASKMKLMKAAPIHEDEKLQNEWLGYIEENPIPNCLNFYDYDYISGIFDGTVHTAPDEDETPARPRKPAEREEPEPKPRRPVTRAAPETEEPTPRRPRPQLGRQAPETEPEDEEPEPKSPAGESIRDRIRRRRAEADAEE